jgi:hypothetical protein
VLDALLDFLLSPFFERRRRGRTARESRAARKSRARLEKQREL